MTRVAMVRPDEVEWRIAVVWCDGERGKDRKRERREERGEEGLIKDKKSEFHASARLNYSSDLEDSLIGPRGRISQKKTEKP